MRFVRQGWLSRFMDLGSILVVLITVAAVVAAVAGPRDFIAFTTHDEKFDPHLAGLNSIEAVAAEVQRRAPSGDRHAQATALEDLLRYRFYHGYSRYEFGENWVLWLAARTIHPDLDAKVFADDILQNSWAACSQQAIVTQAVLNRLGFRTATVEWPAHFTAAAFIEDDWYIVDPWGPMDRDRTRLWRYVDWVDKETRGRILGPKAAYFDRELINQPPRVTKIDEFPAPTMAWFHPLTKTLSNWLWVLALSWAALRLHYRRSRSAGFAPTLSQIA